MNKQSNLIRKATAAITVGIGTAITSASTAFAWGGDAVEDQADSILSTPAFSLLQSLLMVGGMVFLAAYIFSMLKRLTGFGGGSPSRFDKGEAVKLLGVITIAGLVMTLETSLGALYGLGSTIANFGIGLLNGIIGGLG
ncbi:MAG: hypothetical protein GY882_08750 [Actinomycetia bacterium]|nr:hypothetical protein [Actinomycetes bacterium]